MRAGKPLLIVAILFISLANKSDAQQPIPIERRLRLARAMPAGALVYVQARDLTALLRRWLASSQHEEFYKSASYTSFSRSRIFLKLDARRKDFESAIGAGIGEDRLAELAGGMSALALYDIGNTEMVFATELSREKAVAGVLFKNLPRFEERRAEETNYYVAQVSTDGGRLKQQFCFAHANGTLFLTTAEGLMLRLLRSLKGAESDSLLPEVLGMANRANGFSPSDLTLWVAQSRLNTNRYFTANWIHRNVKELGNIESGLIDLRLAPAGIEERRWFAMKEEGVRVEPLPARRAAGLVNFVPASAQLVRLHSAAPNGESLAGAVAEALFGKLAAPGAQVQEIPDRTRQEESTSWSQRYQSLDSRFDKDLDDDLTPSVANEGQGLGVAEKLDSVLKAAAGGGYCEMARSRLDRDGLFVGFERAVIVELKEGASVDREALESAVTTETRARYVVAGAEPQLVWQDDAGVRFLGQSIVEQAAAYAVSGNHLVLGSNRETVAACLRASSLPRAPRGIESPESPVGFLGVVRVSDAKPLFDKLMSLLDGGVGAVTAATSGDDEDREIKFFSENLSSLISALSIREARVIRTREGALLREQINYLW